MSVDANWMFLTWTSARLFCYLFIAGADRPLLGDQHGRSGTPGKGRSQPVLHQPAPVWRDGPRPIPGFRQRPPGQAQAVAPADPEGS